MTAIHEFKCDTCNKRTPAKYNGVHWLPPVGWVDLFDNNTVRTTGEHLCDKCRPPKKKEKK